MASPKTLEIRLSSELNKLRAQHPVTRLDDFRAAVEEKAHKHNRLKMLMHAFLDAERDGKADEQEMAMRGIRGYTRDEMNDAFRMVVAEREKPPGSV